MISDSASRACFTHDCHADLVPIDLVSVDLGFLHYRRCSILSCRNRKTTDARSVGRFRRSTSSTLNCARMFQRLGRAVVRLWPFLLVAWICALVGVQWAAPEWDAVVRDGEFDFLPHDSPSLRGEEVFKRSFPDDVLASSVVIVVRRVRNPDGLLQRDKDFIEYELKSAIEKIAEADGGLAHSADSDASEKDDSDAEANGNVNDNNPEANGDERSIISRVRTLNDKSIGHFLISDDKKATLVIVELTTEFLDARNKETIDAIERLIDNDQGFRKKIPPGLDLATSGPATVGRDMIQAGTESSKSTERWTLILVIALLVGIYRAPFLAIIPLVTVFVATKFTMALLALLSDSNLVEFFRDLEIYVTILSYGAGVDYCLFLIARYKEELESGNTVSDALANALGKVGAALTASASTVMCGIGMMVFAEFGKFRQAGVGITLGLFIVLCATLTFTPTLLRLVGSLAFWPRVPNRQIASTAGWISSTSLFARIMELDAFRTFWRRVGQLILQRPGWVWLGSVGVMLPFAVIGVMYYSYLSYGLLTELPPDRPSVLGAKAVQSHFPAGVVGPVTIILTNPQLNFTEHSDIIADLTKRLAREKETSNIANIRSVSDPYGVSFDLSKTPLATQLLFRKLSHDYYVSTGDDSHPHAARIDVIFKEDPFTRDSIQHLNELLQTVDAEYLGHLLGLIITPTGSPRITEIVEGTAAEQSGLRPGDRIVRIGKRSPSNANPLNDLSELREALVAAAKDEQLTILVERTGTDGQATTAEFQLQPARKLGPALETEILAVGPSASIRDLKEVTDRDQIRIDILVLSGVFLILVILLRRPAISMYLIVSVFFSYLATLGVTFAVFYCLDPAGFGGLDWKVPMFLFTILIAVGEDYNIFLMTRIDEEQHKHGSVDGVIVALERTGGIISSCGLIMAGTFCSLLFGTLIGMHQLGFALAFGVLLDTFVVRPILVPAYLVMLYRGRFGAFGKLLGAGRIEDDSVNTTQVEIANTADQKSDESKFEHQAASGEMEVETDQDVPSVPVSPDK